MAGPLVKAKADSQFALFEALSDSKVTYGLPCNGHFNQLRNVRSFFRLT